MTPEILKMAVVVNEVARDGRKAFTLFWVRDGKRRAQCCRTFWKTDAHPHGFDPARPGYRVCATEREALAYVCWDEATPRALLDT